MSALTPWWRLFRIHQSLLIFVIDTFHLAYKKFHKFILEWQVFILPCVQKPSILVQKWDFEGKNVKIIRNSPLLPYCFSASNDDYHWCMWSKYPDFFCFHCLIKGLTPIWTFICFQWTEQEFFTVAGFSIFIHISLLYEYH